MGRRSKQATSLDADMKRRLPNNHFLRVDELIDWDPIEKRLESLYDPSNGRPSYPPLMMFKALLLQRWFNLSDRGLAEATADRLSFQSFLGLSLTDPIPIEATFCRFR
ncbi:MAG TPA: transposase [Thermosynergistes sp.]|nr:transposase [Thermosynergistes sp.]